MTAVPTPPLDALLARSGLPAGTRLLALATTSIARGDASALTAAIDCARTRGIARGEFEETLLQSVLFFGFPRAVTAFETLARAWPAAIAPQGGALPEDRRRDAGTALFDRIYGRNADAVHAMLRGYHGEFHDFVIESAYGRILARPGLAPRERELIAVAALAAIDQVPQLVAHARGARTFGADNEAVREVLITALGDIPLVDDLMRRIG